MFRLDLISGASLTKEKDVYVNRICFVEPIFEGGLQVSTKLVDWGVNFGLIEGQIDDCTDLMAG